MRRSRATLATIEAAAMVALVASPRTIRSCTGAPAPSASGRPRDEAPPAPRRRGAPARGRPGWRRSIPIRSIWLAGMETSETASAWARTACASRSRLAGARRFESSTSSRRSLPAPEASRSRSKRTPAAMIGPAQHPPAPPRRRRRSGERHERGRGQGGQSRSLSAPIATPPRIRTPPRASSARPRRAPAPRYAGSPRARARRP